MLDSKLRAQEERNNFKEKLMYQALDAIRGREDLSCYKKWERL